MFECMAMAGDNSGTELRSDLKRLAAVRRRDRTADGSFVYAVVTTGVYCRPSCASRTARSENIRFYDSPLEAEAAGYRACKRCRPKGNEGTDTHLAAVTEACRQIKASDGTIRLATLAQAAGMSPWHFHRVFKRTTGVTPKAYAAALRADRVRDELAQGQGVTHALYSAGYGASSRFYAEADKRLGMKPSVYRKGGEGSTIRFAIGVCSLGSILVAATENGVCAIELGDDPESLIRDLKQRFAMAKVVSDDPEFAQVVAEVVAFVEEPERGLDLPLDIRGTAFQQRVWTALRSIPPGRTASYGEIAAVIGEPGAARAVAEACASNPIALAIPCHRVVRADGDVSGYRWGVARKRELLAREATQS